MPDAKLDINHCLRALLSALLFSAFLVLAACSGARIPATTTTAQSTAAQETLTDYTYRVTATYPHDVGAFTEGLVYDDGFLYESTGLVGHSSLRKEDLETGRVLQSLDVPPPYFGEGITIMGGKVYQLTWQSHTGFIYDQATFKQEGQFGYDTEGWGLTNDGKDLIMSDGTATLYYLNPDSLRVTGRIDVTGIPAVISKPLLNELEYVRGEIYANVWLTNYILIINPNTGRVTGLIDLTGIYAPSPPNTDAVLNGIAYDPAGGRLFVTGKLWPHLFQIDIAPSPSA